MRDLQLIHELSWKPGEGRSRRTGELEAGHYYRALIRLANYRPEILLFECLGVGVTESGQAIDGAIRVRLLSGSVGYIYEWEIYQAEEVTEEDMLYAHLTS